MTFYMFKEQILLRLPRFLNYYDVSPSHWTEFSEFSAGKLELESLLALE